jgi:Protein of unknown function DUF262
MLSEPRIEAIEKQITTEKKTVDFDTREFTIEFLVQKYLRGVDEDKNDLFVPDYQREFVWDEIRQSKLIESIILGLPIPIIFVAEDSAGRLEIVDGSQRIRTLAAYLQNELRLERLEKLTEINGTIFEDLSSSRKKKISNTAIRMIVLSESATDEVRNDLFERINRGSDLLKDMEKRKGIYRGEFNDFLYKECAVNPLLKSLTPLSRMMENRQEHEELVLRFFALAEQYPRFRTENRGIAKMLDEYLEEKNKSFSTSERDRLRAEFKAMLEFVTIAFQYGFAKDNKPQVSRVFFEAISVGTLLALREKPDLLPKKIDVSKLLADANFYGLVSGKYKTHTPSKIRQRVEFVRDALLR